MAKSLHYREIGELQRSSAGKCGRRDLNPYPLRDKILSHLRVFPRYAAIVPMMDCYAEIVGADRIPSRSRRSSEVGRGNISGNTQLRIQ